MSGVVLEYQCPQGRDFEVDARGKAIVYPVDDRTHAAGDEPTPSP